MKYSIKSFLIIISILIITIGLSVSAKADIVVYTTDFIPDSSRSGFNGFEMIPSDFPIKTPTGIIGPYTEGGISVTQFSEVPEKSLALNFFHPEGDHGWYPNGGDYGYSQVTLFNGDNFNRVGMNIASGSGTGGTLYYRLLLDGTEVLSGGGIALPSFSSGNSAYIGFSGGGFDTIQLWDRSAGHNNMNAVGIDAIEISTAVPIPGALWLLGSGVVGIMGIRRKIVKG